MLAAMTVEIRRAPYAGWRALAATVVVMAGAVGAHSWAGGHVPPVPGLVLLGTVVLGASWLVVRGAVTWKLLLPAVAVGHAGVHTSLVAVSGHAGHGGDLTGTTPWSARMLLAHAFVAALTAVVWRVCERAALTVLRVLDLRLPRAPWRAGWRPVLPDDLGGPVPGLLHAAPRRGPPVGTGCA